MSTEQKSGGRWAFGLTGFAVLAAIFVGIILVSQMLFRGARVDLTNSGQYTLNAGTKSILKKIPEQINVYFFYSQKATGELPQYQAYALRVRELLEEMSERSDGKLKLTVIDPQPFSEEEDRAVGYGLQQVPDGRGNQIIFGLAATNSTNGQGAIPFFQIDKENFLEYDLAKLLQSLSVDKKPVIGLISGLQVQGNFDPQTQQQTPPWAIYNQIAERFEVRDLGADAKTIESDVKVLMLVHPKNLSEETQFAIDQFVLKGGRLLAFVDPLASMDATGENPNDPSAAAFATKSSDLPKLFQAWGIRYDANQVVADRSLGVPVRISQTSEPVKNPAIIGLEAANMSQLDIASADLESINLDSAGSFSQDEKSPLKLEALLSSSADVALVSADRVKMMSNPDELLSNFTALNKPQVLAANLSGKFKSAFPERSSEAGFLGESKEANTVVLIADTDILTDRVWVQAQQFFNQQVYNAFANNGDFIVNTVDKLTGDGALISIRARGKLRTSFTTVDKLRNEADTALRETEQRLETELQDTERKLAELQAAKGDQSQLILSPEQQQELENFQKKRNDVRKELRNVRRGLDQRIESLGRWVKFFGVFFMPIAVALFAVYFFRRRTSLRKRQAAATA